jgi:hypothetical protein
MLFARDGMMVVLNPTAKAALLELKRKSLRLDVDFFIGSFYFFKGSSKCFDSPK